MKSIKHNIMANNNFTNNTVYERTDNVRIKNSQHMELTQQSIYLMHAYATLLWDHAEEKLYTQNEIN